MEQAYLIDSDGFIEEVYLYKPIPDNMNQIIVLTGLTDGKEDWEEKDASDFVLEQPSQPFYKMKWVNGKWVEGMTPDEIDNLIEQNKPQPSEIDILREENEMNAMAIMELAELIMGGM